MELTVRATSTNLDSESSISLLRSVATTATAILLTSSTLSPVPAARNLRLVNGDESIFGQFKDYEKTLIGFKSSGFESGFTQDTTGVEAIIGFAQKIMEQMTDIPAEYDQIFQKNFRDLLA